MDRRIANDLDRSFRPILLALLCDCHCVTDVTTVAGWASTTAVALSAASASADSVSTASAATLKYVHDEFVLCQKAEQLIGTTAPRRLCLARSWKQKSVVITSWALPSAPPL